MKNTFSVVLGVDIIRSGLRGIRMEGIERIKLAQNSSAAARNCERERQHDCKNFPKSLGSASRFQAAKWSRKAGLLLNSHKY